MLDLLVLEAAAEHVMDWAYVNFLRLERLHQTGEFFITRFKTKI